MANIQAYIRSKLDKFKQSINPVVQSVQHYSQPIYNAGQQIGRQMTAPPIQVGSTSQNYKPFTKPLIVGSNKPSFQPLVQSFQNHINNPYIVGSTHPDTSKYTPFQRGVYDYAQNQIIKPIKTGTQQLQKKNPMGLLPVAGGVFSATPPGMAFNSIYGGAAGAIRSARTGQDIKASVYKGITNPSSIGSEGLGIKNPALALGVDLLTANPKSIIKSGKTLKMLASKPQQWHPEDINMLDRAVDILRTKKGNRQQAKEALYNLAEHYLKPEERPESGNTTAIIKALQKKTAGMSTPYMQIPGMGLVDKNKTVQNKNFTPLKAKMAKVVLQPRAEKIMQSKGGKAMQELKQKIEAGKDPYMNPNKAQEFEKFMKEQDKAPKKELPGNMGGGGEKPPKPPENLTPEEADITAGQAQYGAEDKKLFNDIFARFIGKKDVAKTQGIESGLKFKNVPVKKGWDVITARENPKLKVKEDIAPSVDALKNEYKTLYDDAKKEGVDMAELSNYVTHFWQQSDEQVKQAFLKAKQSGFFQNKRTFDTYEEGMKYGLQPKYTHPSDIISEYGRRLGEVKAGLNFFKELKQSGLIVHASVGSNRPGFKAINAPGFPRSTSSFGDGQIIQGNWYAPDKIADQINRVFAPERQDVLTQGLKVGNKISGTIQDITMSGGIPKSPANAWTFAQATKEALAGRLKSPVGSFFRSLNRNATNDYFVKNLEQIKKMQALNIPVQTTLETGAMADKGILKNMFGENIGEAWNKTMNEPTFKRFMPMLQINLFNDIEKQALRGGKSPGEAADVAAQAVKNFYGITGTDAIAKRSDRVQNALGAIFFAPRYRESMVNFWTNIVKGLKNPLALENRNNLKFAIGATLTFGLYDYLNTQTMGHHIWENPSSHRDKLLIPVGDGNVIGVPFLSSIATMPRFAVKQLGNIASLNGSEFMKENKTLLSSGVRPLADIATNENYFGQEIFDKTKGAGQVAKDIGGYLGGQLNHPYIRAVAEAGLVPGIKKKDQPGYATLSKALELPLRFYKEKSVKSGYYYDAKDEAYKKLKPEEKTAFDAIPKSDPNNPATKMLTYSVYQQYPNVFLAKQQTAIKSAQAEGKSPDPLYTVPYDIAKKYMAYEALPPGDADGKKMIKNNPALLGLVKARSAYYTANPIEGGTESNRPQPTPRAQALMDAGNFKDPEVQQYLNANSQWTNAQRAKLGLDPIAGYGSYAKKPKKIKTLKVKLAKGKKYKFKMPKVAKAKLSKYKAPKFAKIPKKTFKV